MNGFSGGMVIQTVAFQKEMLLRICKFKRRFDPKRLF